MSTDANAENRPSRRRRLRLVLAVVAIAVVVAVTGVVATSSSGTKSTSTTTRQSTSHSSRLVSLQSCLRKEGINLPAPSGGGGQPATGNGAPHAGLELPEGVSRTKFEEAVKKCGGGGLPHGGAPGPQSAESAAA
jgi:hypothetical protein